MSIFAAAEKGDLAELRAYAHCVQQHDGDSWTALHWAAQNNRAEAARLLLGHGARFFCSLLRAPAADGTAVRAS